MTIEEDIRHHLAVHFPQELVDELIRNYLEVKEKLYTREFRNAAFYGGRFAEVMLRVIQFLSQGNYTPLGTPLPTFHNTVVRFNNLPRGTHHDSIRLYIPKALDVLYDIRNNRNVGHVGGDIDENYADANLSLTLCSWVLVEIIRLYYIGDINQAQELVNKLIQIRIPLIQDFDGYLRILTPELPLRNKIMAIAFYKGEEGISLQDLNRFLSHNHTPANIGRSINRLVQLALLHLDEHRNLYLITDAGIAWTEENVPFEIT